MSKTIPNRVWTVAEAKTCLSEVLRLAEEEGPQRIGARRPFVVVPAAVWEEKTRPRKPLGQWLIENVPRGTKLEVPDRSSHRPFPSLTKQANDRLSFGYQCRGLQSLDFSVTTLTESDVETAALAWRPGLSWRITHGPDIT